MAFMQMIKSVVQSAPHLDDPRCSARHDGIIRDILIDEAVRANPYIAANNDISNDLCADAYIAIIPDPGSPHPARIQRSSKSRTLCAVG